ncbi:isoprenylcysteine carboxylmethyltransferase family protein [[Haemophilus] felis]|nr:isoprenylcysteine carboxylmethyltransferase family protein [[Haemophilus] felis]
MKIHLPPPVIFLICALLMWWLPPLYVFPQHHWVVASLVALGLIVGWSSVMQFLLAKTSINPIHLEKSKKLVISGMFKISCNPMYLSLVILLLAWASWLGSASALLMIAVFVLYMNKVQIRREEQFLEQRFGQDYVDYKKKVRRWL